MQIVALLLTPPLITASALYITISYASIGKSFCALLVAVSVLFNALSKILLMCVKAFLRGSGPGAFPPLDCRNDPAGLI